MTEPTSPDQTKVDERRVHHNLRAIFDEACKATCTCFTSTLVPGGMSMHITARRMLHEIHPELTQQEVAILYSAVERFHRLNGKQ